MKILVTGGTGQVGFELQRSFQLHGECLAPSRNELNLYDSNAVDTYLALHQPDLILNAAAYTAVDLAESEVDQAKRLNAELPKQLADYCQKHGASIVHYSSDYVYPGTGDQPWLEDSPTAPQNTYGQTKLDGDQAIIASGCEHLIFRTSWVYSARGHNFMKTMLKLAKDRQTLSIVKDQMGSPTPARLIAQVTALSVAHEHQSHQNLFRIPVGLYHLSPRGETSWQGFAEAIFAQAQTLGESLAIHEVKGIPSSDYPTPAKRPLNSCMNLQKLETALGLQLPTWQQTLSLTIKEYLG